MKRSPARPSFDISPACGRLASLIAAGSRLTGQELDAAADYCARERVPLAEAVVDLGFMHEADAYRMLAQVSGMELIDLPLVTPSQLSLRLVPERIARTHLLLPLHEDNLRLTYAISRPFDEDAEREVATASGRKPYAVLAPRSDIRTALDTHYGQGGDLDLLVARVRSGAEVEILDGSTSHPSSPVLELCNHIVARALDAAATDIHIEPGPAGVVVRYRLDGILGTVMTIPEAAIGAIRNRFKTLAHAEAGVRHRPQDGSFRLRVNNRRVDIRLSTMPTIAGERIVLRLIDSDIEPAGLESLGYADTTLAQLRTALDRPEGLIVVAGPPGSGKTTALYGALQQLRATRSTLISVEDPVERPVPGVIQLPVDARSGNSAAAILQAVLRQDSNVVMVGEITDADVAAAVGDAAGAGHQLLTSLRAADAVGAITRLLSLGFSPRAVADSLSAVVAQRLVRKLCPGCRQRNSARDSSTIGARYRLAAVPMSPGPGCGECRCTGYAGRTPVAEIIVPGDELCAVIARGAAAGEIRALLDASGFRSMRDHALELVSAGVTSIDELERVLDPETDAPVRFSITPKSKGRILVVDDDRVTRTLVRLLCEREGYEVLEAEHGGAGVETAMREQPDLLIVDLLMPTVDGYETIEQIRKDPRLSLVPVVVVTGESDPAIERRVLDLGADDYLVKPFEPGLLLSRIRAAFRRHQRVAA